MKKGLNSKKIIFKIIFVIILLSLWWYASYHFYKNIEIQVNEEEIVINNEISEDIKKDKHSWFSVDGSKIENILELEDKQIMDDIYLRRFINKNTNDLYYLIEYQDFSSRKDLIKTTKINNYEEYLKDEYVSISEKESFFNNNIFDKEIVLTLIDSYTNKKITIFIVSEDVSIDMNDITEN